MNKKNVTLFIAAVTLSACAVNAKTFAEWDFTLASNLDKTLNQIGATGETGSGNTWYKWSAAYPDNFTDSMVFNSSQGYSLRSPATVSEIVGGNTGMTSADRTGKVYMIIDFSSWNLPASITMNFDAGARSGVRLRSTADGVYLDFWVGSWLLGSEPVFGLSAQDVSIAIEYDYDNGNNAQVLYSIGDGDWTAAAGLFSAGRATGQIDYVKWGQVGQLGQVGEDFYYFDVRSITVSTTLIPEPSTYAMVVGALALGGVAIARRRSAKR